MFARDPQRAWCDPFLGLAARLHARMEFARLMRAARHAREVQLRVLLGKLRAAAESDFGRSHDFSKLRSCEDFRRAVPIRDYEGFRPFVQRVIDGHEQALLGPGHRVLMFALTSGSTDQPKYIPVTEAFVRDYRRGWNAFGGKAMLDHPDAFLRGILQVTSPMDVSRTPCGVPCGSISGLLAAAQKGIVRRYYVAPSAAARIADPESRYYTIMRFAVPRDVGWIVTASPATPLKLARTAALHAEPLIRDVRDGTLTPPGELPVDQARVLAARLKPDADTARRLEGLLARRGALLPMDYWRLAFMANWTGGTLALHVREFGPYFGSTPVRDIGLLATEGRVSVGLQTGSPVGLMDVGAGFLEFAEGEDHHGAARGCHELEVGGVYRVIMTTSAGLYRYDIGDCVRVTGYIGQAPLLEFLHRGSRVASITGEKLTEWQVIRAVERCCDGFSVCLSNFVLAPIWGDPPHYRLYLEDDLPRIEEFALRLDRELGAVNMEYAGKRSSCRLGPPSFQFLPAGRLAELDTKLMQARRAGEQYKHQYLLTHPGDDAQLEAGTR